MSKCVILVISAQICRNYLKGKYNAFKNEVYGYCIYDMGHLFWRTNNDTEAHANYISPTEC